MCYIRHLAVHAGIHAGSPSASAVGEKGAGGDKATGRADFSRLDSRD
jgi:hypothetical protein